MNKELLQQSLDALLEYDYAKTDKADRLGSAAIYALRTAIAQPRPATSAKPVEATYDSLINSVKKQPVAEGDAKDAKPSLQAAAQAVLDRWNSPKWEWSKQGPTADLMHNLAAAIASQKAAQ